MKIKRKKKVVHRINFAALPDIISMNTSIIASPIQKMIYVQISFPVKTGVRSATFQTNNRNRAEKFINRIEKKFPNIWDVKMWIWGRLV